MAKHTTYRCNNCPNDERTTDDKLPVGWWQITSHSHFGNTDHFHFCCTSCMKARVMTLADIND